MPLPKVRIVNVGPSLVRPTSVQSAGNKYFLFKEE